jgi:hypothetical protein
VIDHKGYSFPPAVGYGLYMLLRGLWKAASEAPTAPAKSPIITPPIVTPAPIAVKQIAAPALVSPPTVRWTADRELLAWRAWRLGLLVDQRGQDCGPRLLSLSAPCIWDGPAIRVEVVPSAPPENPSGIYTLKPAVAEAIEWSDNELCWVTGTVALSGRVVEHALGYRAECAVIRELRLGVGTHLAVRALETLRQLMTSLEERYQASVDAGLAEREVADRRLTYGFKPRSSEVPSVCVQPPWRLM